MLAKQLSLLREFWTLEFFIRGITAGKLDSFRLDFVSVSDEGGSVINDYL